MKCTFCKKRILILCLLSIIFIQSKGQVWQLMDTTGFGNICLSTSIDVINHIPYVAIGITNSKMSVMKFNGSHWNYVGAPEFIPAGYITLANDGLSPYVAFKDNNHQNRISVMKYDGSNWNYLGPLGFTDVEATQTCIKIDSSKQVYVSYKEGGAWPYGASVKKFDGTNWNHVGAMNFSSNPVDFLEMDFDSKWNPYVVYRDEVSQKATVKKFDGTNWVTIGAAGFSLANASYTSIAFNIDTPYVAYANEADSFRISVMKFDGTNWVLVGPANFSIPYAFHISMKVYGGIPFVSYDGHYSTGSTAVVKMFNGSNWVNVGNTPFATSTASYIDMTFDQNQCYVSYMDWDKSQKVTAHKIGLQTNVGATDLLSATDQVQIAPNPSSGTINISAKKANSFELMDLFGHRIHHGKLNSANNYSERMTLTQRGIYVLKSNAAVQKIIIQ